MAAAWYNQTRHRYPQYKMKLFTVVPNEQRVYESTYIEVDRLTKNNHIVK